jgi:hypothetical protein
MSKIEDDLSISLEKDIGKNEKNGKVSTTRLRTDERVLARITDGIYRQPASALRELIANAYDADATEVYIQTDAPRFDSIIVRDNGQGLSRKALAHVIHHIGGSAKRTLKGAELDVVNEEDPYLSRGGRRLIGKIGIGLFSVAQLTPHFQIISKVKGEAFRRVADVVLTTHREDNLAKPGSKQDFETGSVNIWSVPASDIDAHGTDIILLDLRQQAKDILSSRERWQAMQPDFNDDEENPANLVPPLFHVGELDFSKGDAIAKEAKLPWSNDDPPKIRFEKLVEAVRGGESNSASNPELDKILDNYLNMIWTLSLSAPLDYIEGHPFETVASDKIPIYELSNQSRGQAILVELKGKKNIASQLNLEAMKRGAASKFDVFIDGVQLFRPISIKNTPETSHAIKTPLFFVGKCEPNLDRIPEEFRGGPLAFEAYFLWAPKIVPKEHNGIVIRINDASGTLFDETFLKYQVAEQTRLRQITAEIFVTRGLDAALNIDRESFNFAHPHYQFLSKWVHGALRQLTNIQKRIAKELRVERIESETATLSQKIAQTVTEEWQKAKSDPSDHPPEIIFSDEKKQLRKNSDVVIYSKSEVFSDRKPRARQTGSAASDEQAFEEKIKALIQLLTAYGVFEKMPYKKQQQLLRSIVRIFSVEAD